MLRRILFSRIWSSAQDHAVLVLLLNLVVFFIFTWPRWSGGNDLYHRCTSFEEASPGAKPLNIFTWFIGAGGYGDIISHMFETWYDVIMSDMSNRMSYASCAHHIMPRRWFRQIPHRICWRHLMMTSCRMCAFMIGCLEHIRYDVCYIDISDTEHMRYVESGMPYASCAHHIMSRIWFRQIPHRTADSATIHVSRLFACRISSLL